MKNIVCVFDDSISPSEEIQTVIGEKSFGSVILRRKTLFERFFDLAYKNSDIFEALILCISNRTEIPLELSKHQDLSFDCRVIHYFSKFMPMNEKSFLCLQKVSYVNELIVVRDELSKDPIAIFFPSIEEYLKALDNLDSILKGDMQTIVTDSFGNLGMYDNFMKYISGGFDARYFNSIASNDIVVTKSSSNKKKLKAEYNFYYLLPETQRQWFVAPFNFYEDEDTASYSMERLHFTDVAIRYVHNAISLEEYEALLRRIFLFITQRDRIHVDSDRVSEIHHSLYLTKVSTRIQELQASPKWDSMGYLLKNNYGSDPMKFLFDKYKVLLEKIESRSVDSPYLYAGHGDLCFSNIMYHHEAKLLKFIDPRGAVTKDELWMDEYYDLCKLSHSACGGYDFFNCGLFTVFVNKDLKLNLAIDFDYSEYQKIFKQLCQEFGYNYLKIRIYEASLFLSMLPLHLDYPQKVLGFILNADRIMEEVKGEM